MNKRYMQLETDLSDQPLNCYVYDDFIDSDFANEHFHIVDARGTEYAVGGRYYLVVERSEYNSDDLHTLECILADFMLGENAPIPSDMATSERQLMNGLGFTHEPQTGGGCSAWSKTVDGKTILCGSEGSSKFGSLLICHDAWIFSVEDEHGVNYSECRLVGEYLQYFSDDVMVHSVQPQGHYMEDLYAWLDNQIMSAYA